MSEGQSQCSVASSAQHRQKAEAAAAEERERATVEIAATAARAAMLAMAELAASRAAMHAMAAELKALRGSSTDSSVSADDDKDNELKLVREAAREQAMQWAAAHPQVRRGGSPDGRGWAGGAPSGGTLGGHALMAAAVQTGADTPTAGLTEIVAFTGDAALPPRTGTMVTMGSRPLSGTSVKAVGGLLSPRPTTSSGPR
jgi:hypothetical protein